MDRTTAPYIQPIKTLNILPPTSHKLPNDGELFHLSAVEDEAVKIDLIFDAGSSKHQKLISRLTGELLFSGTPSQSSDQLHESIDHLGGFTNVEISDEEAVVSVLGLRENMIPLIKLVLDAIYAAQLETREVNQLIASKKQQFQIAMEKVSTLARREFLSHIFPDSSYGQLTHLVDFENIERDDLVAFHQTHYIKGLQKIAVVGNLNDQEIKHIIEATEKFDRKTVQPTSQAFNYIPEEIDVSKTGAVQSAIRIGRILFNKQHEDFIDFNVLNMILGGYFGSRLMTSIREEKGYTYGIGSGFAQLKDTGYFFISTEVGEQYKDATIAAVKTEVERLQNELVSQEELDLVRNYITGQLLKNADGPFAQMDRFLSVHKHGKDLSYYNEVLTALNRITPDRIRDLAQQYLNWDAFVIVKAG
ncbi:MAG: M16 family metallopeptidase [Bacteroidota bacterium]